MTIPVELFIWLATAVCGFLSLCVHQLIRLNAQISKICTSHEVSMTQTSLRLEALERHDRRNRQEAELMQRNLRTT